MHKTYDFNSFINRSGTDSLKWDKKRGLLPMWVADMDVESFPGIQEAVRKRAEHGIYGYTMLSDEWFEAYRYWWRERHAFEIKREWLRFVTGVIPAMSSIIRKLSDEGDNVLIQTPVYPAFFRIIQRNKRNVLENRLLYDREKSAYSIDWEDLESGLSDPKTSLMILCNPQNPSGNVWDRETLERIGELCSRHKVTVLSDEIHCDIVAPGVNYVPFASASEQCERISVSFISPTKSFNIAGLQTAAVFAADPGLRQAITECINVDGLVEGNCFATAAVRAAYTEEGADWLDQLRAFLWKNRRLAENYIRENIPLIKPIPSDGSYLMWVDCNEIMKKSDEFTAHLEKEAGLMLNSGKAFGGNGDGFVRINLACPEQLILEGMGRLKKGIMEKRL